MKNYEGMVIIKHFVDPIYHSKIVKCARNIINIKKPEVNSMNFNSNVKKPSNLKFLANDGDTTDNNNISPQVSMHVMYQFLYYITNQFELTKSTITYLVAESILQVRNSFGRIDCKYICRINSSNFLC